MKRTNSSEIDVIVTLEETHIKTIENLRDELAAKGLIDAQVLGSIGIITGRIRSPKLEKLRSIPGVASIDASETIQLPPPESDIQ